MEGDKPGVLRRHLPILQWLPRYERQWLAADALAGLSVWALLVPQALAYAAIAAVPVEQGLYTAFAALAGYAVFGTARQVVQGPSATVAAVSAAVIAPLAGTAALGTADAVPYSAALGLAAGVVYAALGGLRMGWVSNFLSKAVLCGFVTGFAMGIVIDQSHKLIGVNAADGTYVQKLVDTVSDLGQTSAVTLAVGGASLGLLLLLRYHRPRWPRALVIMAAAIAATEALDLAAHGVAVTGHVPTGLFSLGLPDVGWSDTGALLTGALSVVFVGFSESLASARMVAQKHGYDIDPNQELIAQGAACAAAGVVGGFVNDGSLSKSSVADAAGQRTQMASLVNALFILFTMLFLAGLFEDLPSAVLGAVVIDAMVGLFDFGLLRRYYRVNRPDWVFAMGALLGILFFGIIQGILIGVALSLLLLVARASTPAIRRLGRDPVLNAYLDVELHHGLEPTPGLVVVRVDGPLFFADASRFRDAIKEMVGTDTSGIRAVVIDASAVSQSDTDAADMLSQLSTELEAAGTVLVLARIEPSIRLIWDRAGTLDTIGPTHVFETVRGAVDAATMNVSPDRHD